MRRLGAISLLVMSVLAGGGGDAHAPTTARPARAVTVVAVGDIASCDNGVDSATALLARSLAPRAVLTLGDNAYPNGSLRDYARCYAPTWGRFRARTHPSPGNHDYATPGAFGYFHYFGPRSPRPYYSFDLAGWHFVSLNSEIAHARGSTQERWLRRDLTRDSHACELLYWHRPRWSGGAHGSDPGMQALWQAAYDHGVELVLAGHDHNYQRFYRRDARGRRAPGRGVLEVVVGTGGAELYDPGRIAGRAAAAAAYGVLALRLRPQGFGLRFVASGSRFRDALGRQRCRRLR
ncbi:MAG: metallophosphoesterase [Actinomycetota bacterium]|nr:metallophosphoesterase [Actinomycetota bacterium]